MTERRHRRCRMSLQTAHGSDGLGAVGPTSAGVGEPPCSRPRRTPYKKRPIPSAVRREVCLRYGAEIGRTVAVACHYCGAQCAITWPANSPSWPVIRGELDHVVPEFRGGLSVADNLVLTCRTCNRRKGYQMEAPSAP